MATVVGLLLAVGAVAALLAIPVVLRFSCADDRSPIARMQVSWLFGRVRVDLRSRGRPPREARSKKQWPPLSEWVEVWREGLGDRVMAFLRALRRWIRVDELRGRARFGLGDPADTGLLLGWLAAIRGGLKSLLPGLDLELEPDFREAVLGGDAAGELHVVPLGVLPHVVVFALSPVTLRAARRLRPRAR